MNIVEINRINLQLLQASPELFLHILRRPIATHRRPIRRELNAELGREEDLLAHSRVRLQPLAYEHFIVAVDVGGVD